mmetsp:Transcript_75264/g.119653  ORF Transcript_75264/g.119653 Transcript_75264/m.119653 type:complete len:240 (+) Transcript_75264:674-1393(+)
MCCFSRRTKTKNGSKSATIPSSLRSRSKRDGKTPGSIIGGFTNSSSTTICPMSTTMCTISSRCRIPSRRRVMMRSRSKTIRICTRHRKQAAMQTLRSKHSQSNKMKKAAQRTRYRPPPRRRRLERKKAKMSKWKDSGKETTMIWISTRIKRMAMEMATKTAAANMCMCAIRAIGSFPMTANCDCQSTRILCTKMIMSRISVNRRRLKRERLHERRRGARVIRTASLSKAFRCTFNAIKY